MTIHITSTDHSVASTDNKLLLRIYTWGDNLRVQKMTTVIIIKK